MLRELRSAAPVNSRNRDKTAAMNEFLTNAIAFIVVISILVTVHEYGHYIVGRWTGMKVLRFSIGFGKPIWMWRGKDPDQTEYCVASIPLGGYVRFLDSREGSVDPADEGRAFDQRPIASRIAVLLAGPAFNFIFAVCAYWVLFSGGISILKPSVGEVQTGSFAEQAGLETGDRILSVGDVQAVDWDTTLTAILSEMVDDGRVPMLVENESGSEHRVTIDVGDDKTRLTEPGALFDGLGFGIGGPPAIIAELPEDGTAKDSGLAVGDRIAAIDDEHVASVFDLRALIEPRANQTVVIDYERDGVLGSVTVTIGENAEDPSIGYLGVAWAPISSDYYALRDYTPTQALVAGAAKTWDQSVFTVKMLGRIVTGDVSIKNISGPINIAQIAGESAERGWRYFVTILAVISLSLGVLNLLPIPVLDGGQIVYQLVELAKGSPMTERAQIMGQQVGILALLLLMSFAFYNDIARILG